MFCDIPYNLFCDLVSQPLIVLLKYDSTAHDLTACFNFFFVIKFLFSYKHSFSLVVLKLWFATHWYVVKHSEVGREAFVRLVIKTPTGVPQHQFRRKSNARRAKEPFFFSLYLENRKICRRAPR